MLQIQGGYSVTEFFPSRIGIFSIPGPEPATLVRNVPVPGTQCWGSRIFIPDPDLYPSRIPVPLRTVTKEKKFTVPGYVGQLFRAETAGEVRQLGGPGFAQQAARRRQTTAGQPARLYRPVPVLQYQMTHYILQNMLSVLGGGGQYAPSRKCLWSEIQNSVSSR